MSEHVLADDAAPAAPIGEIVHPTPYPERELIMHLEPDQLVTETFRRVPRAQLAASAVVGLWGLRIFCVLVSLMVIYTFIARLH